MDEQMTRIMKNLADALESGLPQIPPMAEKLLEAYGDYLMGSVWVGGLTALLCLPLLVLCILSFVHFATEDTDHPMGIVSFFLGLIVAVIMVIMAVSALFELPAALEPLGSIISKQL